MTDPKWYTLYVDGQFLGGNSGHIADLTGSSSSIFFGKNNTDNVHFQGAIDDIRIYNRRLYSSEVQQLYTQGGWPSATPPAVGVTTQGRGPLTLCRGDSVQLEARPTGPVQRYRWTPNTGLSSDTSRTPWAKPNTTTTYTVWAYGPEPCPDSTSATITVTINQPPKLSIANRAFYACAKDSVLLGVDAEGNGPFSYEWTPAAGVNNPSSQRPRAMVQTSTRYYVTVRDANGCTSKDSIFVTVLPAPVANAGRDTTLCRGSSLRLGIAGSAENRYIWSPRAGLNDSTVAQPVASPDTTTTYYLMAVSPTNCKAYDTIIVQVKPAAAADAGRDTVLCAGGSVVLGTASAGGYIYQWTPAAGLSSPTAAQSTATPAATTTYYLTATNAAGCEAVDSVTVTVLKPAMSVDKPKLDFGKLDGCTSTKELELTLTNTGESDLRVTDVTSAGFSIVSPARPIDLKVGKSTKVIVRYSPTAAGATTGTLVLHGEPCGVEVTVDLSGSKDQSDVAASVGSIDFGKRLACETIDSTIEVTITNSSATDATLKPSVVSVPFTATTTTTLIPAGQTVTVQVRYTPTAAGNYSDDLKLPYESGACRDTLRIAVSGLVEKPALVPDAGAIDFGTLSGCETGRDTTITLRNDGVFDITIDGTTLPSGYKIVGTGPGVVGAGKSVALRLRYEPAASGPSGGNLVLRFDPCDGELRIPLSGTKQGVSFALPDTVDFGQLIDCREPNKSQKLAISYSGDASTSGSIKSAAITGPFTSTMNAGSPLNNGTPTTFDVTFTPTADGSATGYVDLALEPCGVTRRIVLQGNRASATLTAQPVNFGTRPSGTTASLQVLFVHTGTTPLQIDNIDGIAAPFTITGTTPAVPATLQPGDTLRVDVHYTATSGQSIDTVRAHIGQPCVLVSNAEVRGTGESGAAAVIAVPAITAAAGERIRLPLLLQSSTNLDGAGARNFTATISFNRSLLIPVEKFGMSVDQTTRRVTISGTRGTTDTLAVVPMTVLLGTAPTTPLKLESFTWTDATGAVQTTLVDGELTLSDLCYIGGARLIDGSGEIILKPATPNPATGMVEIEYAIVEDGMTQLYVVDASGQRVATVVEAMQPGGRYLAQLETGTLAIGSYFCVLQTPTQMLVQKLEVRK